jgi:hypothetical protein
MESMDWRTAVVAGIVFGGLLFVQSLIGEILAWRRGKRKEQSEQAVVDAARTVATMAPEIVQHAATVTDRAEKVEKVLNGQGIMGALRRILAWQGQHEQADEVRDGRAIGKIDSVKRMLDELDHRMKQIESKVGPGT